MAGWGSNNKFSMLGAMRAIAQMVSYELPLIITVLAGRDGRRLAYRRMRLLRRKAATSFGIVPRWFVFTPWGAAAFILFFVSGLVESNRTPFDVPEGESEIVAGHMTEYSGFKYATFFMAEYLGMFAISGLAVTLVPRRLACARARARICSLLRLVFREAERAALRLHLASRHAAAHARGSSHEFRLEIHAADGVHLHHRRCRLALCRARLARLALVARRDRGCLYRAVGSCSTRERNSRRALIVSPNEHAPLSLSSRFSRSPRALAAATLPKLIHAALCLVARVCSGVAAFFFLLGAEFVGLVQVFVYVGAVAVLIVFTILLTRRDSKEHRGFNWSGVLIALAVFARLDLGDS